MPNKSVPSWRTSGSWRSGSRRPSYRLSYKQLMSTMMTDWSWSFAGRESKPTEFMNHLDGDLTRSSNDLVLCSQR